LPQKGTRIIPPCRTIFAHFRACTLMRFGAQAWPRFSLGIEELQIA
jgi:hypothetical protein